MANENWPVHNLAIATVKSMQAHERKEADFYPTPAEVTQALLDLLQLPKHVRIWEPACGDGVMVRTLKENGYENVIASDLRHTGYGIGGFDFLKRTLIDNPDAIITNPPFNVADQFIYRAVNSAPVVAMLLKSNYWHTKNRLALYREMPPTGIHPITWRPAFLEKERGKNPLMDVMWCVWERDKIGTKDYAPLPKPEHYPEIVGTPLTVSLAALADAIEDAFYARAA